VRRNAEEQVRRKAEEQARRKAEEQARRKAEEQARQEADEEQARRNFGKSNYLRIYDETPKKPQAQPGATKMITKALKSLNMHKAARRYNELRNSRKTVVEAAVALWTADVDVEDDDDDEGALFQRLNRVIIKDDCAELRKYMGFIRLTVNWITRPSHKTKTEVLVYRGSRMTILQAQKLQIGTVFRAPMFVCTSRNRDAAVGFAQVAKTNHGGVGYVLTCRIPAGCRNAYSVAAVSEYVDEEEVLIPPYSPFRVTAHDAARMQIELELHDGQDMSHTLPSYMV
jgi:hypothetical protein